MLTAEQFRQQVDGFLEKSRMKPSAFGRTVLGDPNFVSDLRKGREPSLRVVGKVLKVIAPNAPKTASRGNTADHVSGSSSDPSARIPQSFPADVGRPVGAPANADVSPAPSDSHADPEGAAVL